LIAATQSGTISTLDLGASGELVPVANREKAHQGTSWAVRYVDKKHALSSGSAGDLKLWEINTAGRPPMPHVSAFPSQSSILSLDILSSDKPTLALCCSLDNTLRVLSVMK